MKFLQVLFVGMFIALGINVNAQVGTWNYVKLETTPDPYQLLSEV